MIAGRDSIVEKILVSPWMGIWMHMGFHKWRYPIAGSLMENPVKSCKMDDLRVPQFEKPPYAINSTQQRQKFRPRHISMLMAIFTARMEAFNPGGKIRQWHVPKHQRKTSTTNEEIYVMWAMWTYEKQFDIIQSGWTKRRWNLTWPCAVDFSWRSALTSPHPLAALAIHVWPHSQKTRN